jgi:hypothetical protein
MQMERRYEEKSIEHGAEWRMASSSWDAWGGGVVEALGWDASLSPRRKGHEGSKQPLSIVSIAANDAHQRFGAPYETRASITAEANCVPVGVLWAQG